MSTDPFFPLLLAAEHSERIELMTSIAVAFARSPMTLANVAHDLNEYSNGRFILGLGSQIKPHIARRFSLPWSKPAARMREFIQAMRAIWDCWYEGKPLDFRGEFYSHTLMTPMFTPTGMKAEQPRVFLAAVGPLMTEVAGEVADGVIAHAFTTERHMTEVTLPAIERGLEKSGRSRSDFAVSCPVFVISGDTEEAMEASRLGGARHSSLSVSIALRHPHAPQTSRFLCLAGIALVYNTFFTLSFILELICWRTYCKLTISGVVRVGQIPDFEIFGNQA